MASASVFDSISTGNIELFSNLGNHGMSSEDVAAMLIEMAKAQANIAKEAEVNEQQERERRLIISISATIGLGLFLLIIYLLSQKLNYRGKQ